MGSGTMVMSLARPATLSPLGLPQSGIGLLRPPQAATALGAAASTRGAFDPGVGQMSDIYFGEQSVNVPPQDQPIPMSLASFGSSFSAAPRTDTAFGVGRPGRPPLGGFKDL
jgi:hypothetical protein